MNDGQKQGKDFRIKIMMSSNPISPCVPASPVHASGVRGLLGSTFLSSVGQEESTDTKIPEDRDDRLDIVQRDYDVSKDEASNQLNSFTDMINSISFNKSIESGVNSTNKERMLNDLPGMTLEAPSADKLMLNFSIGGAAASANAAVSATAATVAGSANNTAADAHP